MVTKSDPLLPYREFDWSGWTEWMPLAQVERSDLPSQPGAYVVSTGGDIRRAVGTDPLGILDVGEAGGGDATLRSRIVRFRACATKRGTAGHMAGWRYAFFHFNNHFPLESLRVRWIPTATKEEAYAVEGRVLLTYVLRHGELPPLNYKFNWSAFETLGWDAFDNPSILASPS